MQNPSPFVASRPPLSCPFIFFQLSYFLTFSPKNKNSRTIFGPKDLKIEVFSSLNSLDRSHVSISFWFCSLWIFCANIFAKLCCHVYNVKYVICSYFFMCWLFLFFIYASSCVYICFTFHFYLVSLVLIDMFPSYIYI